MNKNQSQAEPASNSKFDQIKGHPIFAIATERPLLPDEVEVYLAVKARISGGDVLVSKTPGTGRLANMPRANVAPIASGHSAFDID
ncbi:hypothetical protein BLL52_4280 [Rhodoferax antarcticus ANT.BR]|uniref:Uncharacterized protein n=2 Tax=Rhodoferax antarcticus TaxID=81479 RepID=A0A1Q8Y8Y6_9BURK|nr:hypothetical protein BLL52_4280 [Rhodoferax antarcticus ANT.BR]